MPESHLEPVKTALFARGAGRYKAYDQCCWQVVGTGQFRPLPASKPYLGNINQLVQLSEVKVEMICDDAFIKDAVEALIQAHPYEEPAYEIYPFSTIENL